jgi:hypothetical protein
LGTTATHNNIFSLSNGERYKGLFLTHPSDKIVPHIETSSLGALSIISISSPICIRIS